MDDEDVDEKTGTYYLSYKWHCSEDVNATYTGRFIMLSVITNIYNKKNKGPNVIEFFTPTGKLKKFFFWGGGDN
jgi:hypothetical protein